MLTNRKVSVIVPIYNSEKYLNICVDSLLTQTVSPFEVILIDDGSQDDSPKICDDYKNAHENIIVVHKENGGLSDARNNGLDIASGEYITFVDSDDLLDSRFIERMLSVSADNDADIVQCRFLTGTDRRLNGIFNGKVQMFNSREAFLSNCLKVCICANLYKKELFDDFRFPLLRIYEDESSYYKLIYISKKIALIEDQLYYYFHNPEGLSKKETDHLNDSFISVCDERIKFFEAVDDDQLVMKSKERMTRSLMVFYVRCFKNKNNTNDKTKYIQLIRGFTKKLVFSNIVSFPRKMEYLTFSLFPHTCSRASIKLKLNVRFIK